MTTPRKLTIAAVVLLVCGVVVALMMRPAPGLVLTLKGVTTNKQGVAEALILVGNASTRTLYLTAIEATAGTYSAEPLRLRLRERIDLVELGNSVGWWSVSRLDPAAVANHDIPLPQSRPCRVVAVSLKRYPANWRGRIQAYLDRVPIYYNTVEIPE